MRQLLTHSNLQAIDTVVLLRLYLSNLAAIHLNYCTGCQLPPFVPEVCHTNFVADETHPF